MKQRNEALLIELMAECTDMLLGGASIAACLERFPEHAAALEPLLTTAATMHALRSVPPRAPEAAARSRAAFVAAAYRGAATQAPAAPTWPDQLRNRWRRLSAGLTEALGGYGAPRTMPAGLAALLAIIMLVGLLTTGAITASARALPGDMLYPVKLTTENLAIFLARDPVQRAALGAQFAERRLTEIRAVLTLGRAVRSIPIAGQIESLGPKTWRVAGLDIEIIPQTQIEGTPRIGARVEGIVRAPGDGGLIAIYLSVAEPPAGQVPPTTPPAQLAPPATPAPTATATPAATATDTADPLSLPSQRIFEPTDAPTATATDTPTATSTPTRTPRPTATPTATPTTPPTPARAVITGRIVGWVNGIEPDYWLIDGNKVETTGETEIVGNPGLGWRVEAEVEILPGDRYIGRRITALAGPDYVEPWSAIEDVNAKNGGVWTIGGFQVHIGPDTVIEGDPQIGDTVDVSGERRASGEIWAKRITVVRSHRYDFFGWVQSISGSIWIIEGTAVRVTDQTQLIGDPGVGDWVGVSASLNSRNELIALLIYVTEPPEPVPPPTATAAATATSTPTATATATPADTPAATATTTPTDTPVATATATPTDTPAATATP